VLGYAAPADGAAGKDMPAMATTTNDRRDDRRNFLRKSLAAGAAAGSAGLLMGARPALATRSAAAAAPTAGDIAILKFLAAAELVEDDLWQQYDELAGAATRSSSTPT
jgi:hypothetical protein